MRRRERRGRGPAGRAAPGDQHAHRRPASRPLRPRPRRRRRRLRPIRPAPPRLPRRRIRLLPQRPRPRPRRQRPQRRRPNLHRLPPKRPHRPPLPLPPPPRLRRPSRCRRSSLTTRRLSSRSMTVTPSTRRDSTRCWRRDTPFCSYPMPSGDQAAMVCVPSCAG